MLKEKMRQAVESGNVVLPAYASKGNDTFETQNMKRDDLFDNPKFTHIEFGGVYAWPEETGIDQNGDEHLIPGKRGFSFTWAAEGIGFGEIRIQVLPGEDKDVLEIKSDGLGKDFVKKALCALVDSGEDNSEEHLKALRAAAKNSN